MKSRRSPHRQAARACERAAFALAERWELTRAELAILLGLRSTSTLDNWRRKPLVSLAPDTLERISYLLHIHRALRQMFPAERGVDWPRRPIAWRDAVRIQPWRYPEVTIWEDLMRSRSTGTVHTPVGETFRPGRGGASRMSTVSAKGTR